MTRWTLFDYIAMTAALLAAAVLAALPVPAHAQAQMQMVMPCWPRPVVTALLNDKFKEVPDSFGVNKKSLVELYTSPTGSWTIIITAPLGLTCVLASGDSWEKLPPPPAYGHPT